MREETELLLQVQDVHELAVPLPSTASYRCYANHDYLSVEIREHSHADRESESVPFGLLYVELDRMGRILTIESVDRIGSWTRFHPQKTLLDAINKAVVADLSLKVIDSANSEALSVVDEATGLFGVRILPLRRSTYYRVASGLILGVMSNVVSELWIENVTILSIP